MQSQGLSFMSFKTNPERYLFEGTNGLEIWKRIRLHGGLILARPAKCMFRMCEEYSERKDQ